MVRSSAPDVPSTTQYARANLFERLSVSRNMEITAANRINAIDAPAFADPFNASPAFLPGIGFSKRPHNRRRKRMPEKRIIEKAKQDLREGKSASTAAGEFVREEIHHVREGKHGARSPQQAIAIGLSEARRAGIPLKPPKKGKTSSVAREKAERDYEKGQHEPQRHTESSTPRSRARSKALQREPKNTTSRAALSRQARTAARRRRASS
jgi:hypothetical protein